MYIKVCTVIKNVCLKPSTAFHHVPLSCSKEKRRVKRSPKMLAYGLLWSIQIQKEVISIPKQPSHEKRVRPPKSHGEKRCEI